MYKRGRIDKRRENKYRDHYNKIKKKKGANIAATAAARKLLQVIYHMLKNKEIFRREG